MRATPAFDQVQLAVVFISAVDCQVEPFCLVQRNNFDPDLACHLGGAVRCGHAFDLQSLIADKFTKTLYQPSGGRPGAKPDFHAGFNIAGRLFGCDEFGSLDR